MELGVLVSKDLLLLDELDPARALLVLLCLLFQVDAKIFHG
ncbi:hypothetical protein SynMVIR181_02234 [Synechococcus sp. MVIR-18-1]|nr:hypothetical protein SynMVIR181_02234 [Synechococcus sp. MVIR-18-1]